MSLSGPLCLNHSRSPRLKRPIRGGYTLLRGDGSPGPSAPERVPDGHYGASRQLSHRAAGRRSIEPSATLRSSIPVVRWFSRTLRQACLDGGKTGMKKIVALVVLILLLGGFCIEVVARAYRLRQRNRYAKVVRGMAQERDSGVSSDVMRARLKATEAAQTEPDPGNRCAQHQGADSELNTIAWPCSYLCRWYDPHLWLLKT
jgi:hypothetical protein